MVTLNFFPETFRIEFCPMKNEGSCKRRFRKSKPGYKLSFFTPEIPIIPIKWFYNNSSMKELGWGYTKRFIKGERYLSREFVPYQPLSYIKCATVSLIRSLLFIVVIF
jgi:hypothetical protein